MSMVTRCPACATLFRVTARQLQARSGKVRCGRCATVFDGFRDLATLPERPPVEPLPAETATREPFAAAIPPTSAPEALQSDFASPAMPATAAVPAGFRFEASRPPPETNVQATRSAAVRPEARADDVQSASPPPRADALFLQQAHAARRGGLSAWTLGSALLLITLAAQATYFYRGELAAHSRALKPLLVGACQALGCEVPLPQRPKLINIEASDLQGLDPARPGMIELTATLRNHADHDLAYPALDLVLTNTREHTLARRVFLPREYLAPSRDVNAGFAAKAEITIRLGLDTGDLGAAGFRLDLLPAPAR